MAVDFSRRSMQSELMDTEVSDYALLHQCLQQLEIVNILSLAYRPTLRWLGEVLRGTAPGASVSIFDVGSGGGDMLRRIWKRLQSRGFKPDLVGVDLNAFSKRSAEETTPATMDILYETSNIFSFDSSRQADFIISCNFTHHLTDAELVTFIRWMETHARRGWLINDLHRHWLPYWFIKTVFNALPFNRMMRSDGPISITRAFRADDWRRILAQAGIAPERYAIRWFFPFRYVVACRKA
ncbi:MAG TPA: methyltransferase domain-containing protein [Xanthobacteraceae bacterium]|nr:methyltransferase domain-containing protein [Xanthobacteraceae bacterium]